MLKQNIRVLVAVVAALSGCADGIDDAVEGERSAVVHGNVVPPGVMRGVGSLQPPPPAGQFGSPAKCTATMLTQRYFLTAAQCIGHDGSRRGGTLSLELAPALAVDRIFSLGNNLEGQHDLAVGNLTANIPTTIARGTAISTTPANFNSNLTMVGFGCDRRDIMTGAGVKRFLSFTRNTNDDVGCLGDEGAPAFHGFLADGGQIALVYSGWNNDAIGADSHDYYADAVLNRNNLYSIIDGLQQDGICYRVHAANLGWMPVVCNGAYTGTIGQNRTLYAVQIWSNRPNVQVCYEAYVSNIGWQGVKCDSDMAGTLGFADKGIQALRIRASGPSNETVSYVGYVGGVGYTGLASQWGVIGTPGSGRRLEAFRVDIHPY